MNTQSPLTVFFFFFLALITVGQLLVNLLVTISKVVTFVNPVFTSAFWQDVKAGYYSL